MTSSCTCPDPFERCLEALPTPQRTPVGAWVCAIVCWTCLVFSVACPRSARAQQSPASQMPVLSRIEPDSLVLQSHALGASKNPGPWVPSLGSMGRDAVSLVTAPLRLDDGWQIVGTSAFLFGLVAEVDRTTSVYLSPHVGTEMNAPYAGPLAGPGRFYDRVGPDRFLLGTAGLMAAGGIVAQNQKLTRTSVRIGEALVFTNLLTDFFKGLISRHRPNAGIGAREASLGKFSMSHSELSMPSGHTARAFALASVLSHSFDRWYVQIPSYALATSVGLQRIESGNHWLSDVVVGGALGYFVGRVVTEDGFGRDGVSYTPVLSPNRVGLTVNF